MKDQIHSLAALLIGNANLFSSILAASKADVNSIESQESVLASSDILLAIHETGKSNR